MYANRNSLIILVFLLIVIATGYFLYDRAASQLEVVRKENSELTIQLRGALEVSELLAQVSMQRDSMEQAWNEAPKKILNTQEPAFSLSYVNWLIQNYGLLLDFDFYLNEKTKNEEYTTFSYTVSGDGSYRDICSLVWLITHNPILYQIESVILKRSEDIELLSFVIKFQGFSMNKEWDVGSELTMTPVALDWRREFAFDAFASLAPRLIASEVLERKSAPPIKVTPPKPVEPPNLLDASKVSLLAITNDKAYLRANDGKVTALRVGDRVRGGRLSRIDQQRNQVEFMLENENGVNAQIRLDLEYN